LQQSLEVALAELQTIPGLRGVQRIVCGGCHDFKIVTALDAAAFAAWEEKEFAPEKSFLEEIQKIGNVDIIETQTYTLEQVGTQNDVSGTKVETGRRAAVMVAEVVRSLVAEKGAARIIVATGASQFEFLQALVAEKSVPWDKVTAFHLDEYVGMSEDHKASFRGYLQERLFSKAQPSFKEVHFLGGPTGAVAAGAAAEEACAQYSQLLMEGPIDIACIGIGENGHIAFNDPPVCDFEDPKMVKVAALDEQCRQQQVGEGWFPSLAEAPTHALTLTVPAIMRSNIISVVAPDLRKANAIKEALEGPITTACPASILRKHPHCHFWLDLQSASAMNDREQHPAKKQRIL